MYLWIGANCPLYDTINAAYDEIVKWIRNLFMVPTGRAGQLFVAKVTICTNHFNDAAPAPRSCCPENGTALFFLSAAEAIKELQIKGLQSSDAWKNVSRYMEGWKVRGSAP